MWPRLASNTQSSCLYFPESRDCRCDHHAQLTSYLETDDNRKTAHQNLQNAEKSFVRAINVHVKNEETLK
jgi:hypothetical protein